MKKNYAYNLALGGILAAISILLIYMTDIVPALELTQNTLASIVVGFYICETDTKRGSILYFVVILVSTILLGNKLRLIPYVLLGGFGFIKLLIEMKFQKAFVQIALKLCYFLFVFSTAVVLLREVFISNLSINNYLLVGATCIFGLIYDYIYTLGLYWYKNKIGKKKINIRLSGDEHGDEKR